MAPLAALAVSWPFVLAHGSPTLGGASDAGFQLPAWSVWAAGVLVVALSFLLVAASTTRQFDHRPAVPPAVTPATPRATAWRALGAVFVLALAAQAARAIWSDAASAVIAPSLVWTGLMGVLLAGAYLFGDAQRHLAPLDPWLARLGGRARWTWRAGAWPAVALALGLFAVETLRPAGAAGLAYAAIAYLGLAVSVSLVWGWATWRDEWDAIGKAFRLFAQHAPLHRDAATGRVAWRAPWQGLRALRFPRLSDLAFLVTLLFGVTFDAFLGTQTARQVIGQYGATGQIGLLLVGDAVFLAAFVLTARACRRVAETAQADLAGRLAASLVPIAVGYHAAHNLPYVLQQLPVLTTVLINPFGLTYSPIAAPWTFGNAGVALIAVAQLCLITTGHVIAVVTAHETAHDSFHSRVQAYRSEWPLTAIMLFYTLIGLALVGGHA